MIFFLIRNRGLKFIKIYWKLSKKFSLLSNPNHLKILLSLKENKSVKKIHSLSLFSKYSSTYKALQKLVGVGLIKKEKGPNKVGDVYCLP